MIGHSIQPEAATAETMCRQIARYIEQDPYQPGDENARVTGVGISVAAIVTALLTSGGDRHAVAEAFALPEEAVQAAVWYYALHKPPIDARLALDEGFFLATPQASISA